jgi:cytochrome c
MRKTTPILLLLLFISCKDKESKSPEVATQASGKELFTTNNCTSCHQIDQKIIGPSLNEIAEIYKKNNASMVDFLKGEADPIVDKSQAEIMKANLEITKTMSDEDLQAIANYINNPTE